MPWDAGTKTISRLWRFVDQFISGDEAVRSAFDTSFDDLVTSIQAAYDDLDGRVMRTYDTKSDLIASGLDYDNAAEGDVIRAGNDLLVVVASDAVSADYHEITVSGGSGSGGLKMIEAGPNFASFDAFIKSIETDLDWSDGDVVTINGTARGARLAFDESSTETADATQVFAPAGGGRFKAVKEGGALRLSQLGLIDSSSIDQSVKFQRAVTIASAERARLIFDLDVDCAGADIWVNVEGAYNGYESGTRFHWLSDHRSGTHSLTNAYLTFGKMYVDQSAGSDGTDLRWSPNSAATPQARIENLSFEGCVRFHNIEGTLILDGCKFEPELGNASFLSSFPSTWAENPLGVTDTDGVAVPTVLYTDPLALVEFNYCNHMLVKGCNFQNGQDFTNGAGDGLHGMTMSQCSNPTIISGRTVHNNIGCKIGAHPILGGSGLTNVTILDQHIEENTNEGYLIDHGKNIFIRTQGRPQDDGSLITQPIIRISNSASAPSNVQISGWIDGPNTSASSVTAIKLEGGENVNVDAYIQNVGIGIDVSATTRLGSLKPVFGDDVDRRIQIENDVVGATENTGTSDFSPVAFAKMAIGGYTDLTMPSHNLREYKGTAVTATTSSVTYEANGPGLTAVFGASGAEDMTDGFKLATSKIYQPTKSVSTSWVGALVGSSSVIGNNANVAWFIGFSTQSDADTIPAEVTGAGAVTATDTDFVGFLFTRYASGATIHAVARKDGGTVQVLDTGVQFTSASTQVEYRVEIRRDGDAKMSIGGHELDFGTNDFDLSGAVDPSDTFGFVVSAHSLVNYEVDVTIPWVATWQERKKS